LSAGADPGPACYGKSDRATVTDANVVLGRLSAEALLGGTFAIEAARSHTAISTIAGAVGLSVEQAASGIVAIVDAQMAKALRIVTLERGLDPREFTLAAFGGGGPLHACALAEELGIARIVVPARPGVFSAQGLLAAELHERFTAPVMRVLDDVNFAGLDRTFATWEDRGTNALRSQGAAGNSIRFRRGLEARYAGQSFELTIAYESSAAGVARLFHAAHRARYGYDAPDERIEIVGARLTATGTFASTNARVTANRGVAVVPDATPGVTANRDVAVAPDESAGVTPSADAGLSPHAAQQRCHPERSAPQRAESKGETRTSPLPIGTRPLWLGNAFVPSPVFARDALKEGDVVSGPAIVEQYDTTTYVAPGWTLRVRGDILTIDREIPA